MNLHLSIPQPVLRGTVHLDGSKSISNRVLIVRAICGSPFPIEHLSSSDDTRTLETLLHADADVLDAGAAGTTYRFMTAYLALSAKRPIMLTGSPRMLQRPIGPLVESLRALGAHIDYVGNEGFPPLRIHPPALTSERKTLNIPASTSSQFVSALLLCSPLLPGGLELHLEGELVSRPYVEMTRSIMKYFGVESEWKENGIWVPPQKYQPRPFKVEADWSAASYYYSMVAIAQRADLQLEGLFADSLQGDAVVAKIMEKLGVGTEFAEKGVRIYKMDKEPVPFLEQDFLPCPDLVQTVAVACAALGVHGLFTGLETLRIKETDRIEALRHELAKVGVLLTSLPARFSKRSKKTFFSLEGKARVEQSPRFKTWDDHRMAMSLAPLALLGSIVIEEPRVVSKSYPAFWEDLQKIGFHCMWSVE